MISLLYLCASCAQFETSDLDSAQRHADTTGHTVRVSGTITPRVYRQTNTLFDSAATSDKVRDNAVLRAARDRGLLKRR